MHRPTTDHPDSPDDRLLTAYARTASPDAFAAIVRRHGALVYSAARRQIRDPHLAEDVAQAVFIVLTRKAATIRPGALSAWLLQATRYAAADAHKRETRRQFHERNAATHAEEQAMTPPTPDRADLLPALDDALASLGEADRAVLLMRYYEGKTSDQIASLRNSTAPAVRKRLERALDRLRRRMTRDGAAVAPSALPAALSGLVTEPIPAALSDRLTAAPAGSAAAMTIAEGVRHMMLIAKLKVAAAIVAGLALVGAAAPLIATRPTTIPAATRAAGIPLTLTVTGTDGARVVGYYVRSGQRVPLAGRAPMTLTDTGISSIVIGKADPAAKLHARAKSAEGEISMTVPDDNALALDVQGGFSAEIVPTSVAVANVPAAMPVTLNLTRRADGAWMLFDPNVGIDGIRLADDAARIIDALTADDPAARLALDLRFSDRPFPGSQLKLTWIATDPNGERYHLASPAVDCVLAGELFRYFPKPPRELHLQARAAPGK